MNKKYLNFKYILTTLTFSIIILSCGNRDYVPKPRGYFRINFPKKDYITYSEKAPYSFEYPNYAKITPDTDDHSEPYWINIDFPNYKGKIHISYKKINKNLPKYIEDSRSFVYKHTSKAKSISEEVYVNPEHEVYGILYNITGNAASSVQFFVTDSSSNFLRGALYFNVQPNSDSLAPVISFIKEDIIHLMETCSWN